MWNNGADVKSIKNYLDMEDKCDEDEMDFILEGIEGWISSRETAETVVEEDGPKNKPVPIPEPVEPVPLPDPLEPRRVDEKPAGVSKVRKQRVAPIGKKLSPANLIQQMQEKIKAIQYLEAVELSEIDSELSKDIRDELVAFSKEIDTVVNKYLEIIQGL